MSRKLAVVVFFEVILLLFLVTFSVFAAQTCPDGGGWTKIDSGNLNQYPVSGATEYCFKAGTEVYDDLESWQSSGKDLSHWSYYLPERTSTPVPTPEPTETPIPTQEPTNTPAPTDTPEPTNTSTPPTGTPRPTNTPGTTSTPESTNTPPPGSTPTHTATPGRTGTGTPTSTPWTATPSPDPRIPCPCVYETVLIQGEGGEHDHIALWAAITLLAGTNGAWMIKRRKLGN